MAIAHRDEQGEDELPISEAIRNRRTELGMRREDVAAAVGVSFDTVRHWERGENGPNWDTLQRLCKVFGWGLPFVGIDSRVSCYQQKRQSQSPRSDSRAFSVVN